MSTPPMTVCPDCKGTGTILSWIMSEFPVNIPCDTCRGGLT